MADANTPVVPAIDPQVLATAVGDALAKILPAAIAQANAPLIEQLGKLQTPAPAVKAADADGKEKPLTAADLTKMLDDRDQRNQQTSQQAAQRDAFVASKMKDLPEVYRKQLGTDPTNWQAEEQQLRESFRSDFKGLGGKVEDIGNDKPGGTTASAAPADLSKLSPLQLVTKGLADAPVARPAPATVRTQPAALVTTPAA